MYKKSGRFRVLIINDDKDAHTSIKDRLHAKPRPNFITRIKNFFSPSKIIPAPLFEIDSAMNADEAHELVKQSLIENSPYSVVLVALGEEKNADGVDILKSLWEIDKELHAIICFNPEDPAWQTKTEALPVTDNYVILREPYDSVSLRQLAYTLARKRELNQLSKLHADAFEQHVKEKVSELHQKANFDMLTKLPNRAKLLENINQLVTVAELSQKPFAVFFFDLDRFKFINDALTHTVGDEVLVAVAERLREAAADYPHLIGRFNGDEFVVVVEGYENENALTAIVKQFSDLFKKPFDIGERKLKVTSSMGISLYPKDGSTAHELLCNADVAMYAAKDNGHSRFQFYDNSMNVDILKRFDFEYELLQAVEAGQFVLHYQPEFNVTTGILEGVEALMRWNHPERGLIMPEDFITVAEETGLIIPMGAWALRAVCLQNKIWQDTHLPKLRIAVNITGLQFEDPGFVELVKDILSDSGLSPDSLELEITENVIIKNNSVVNTVIELKKLGTKIALDDFGSGYSNINYLKQLPVDRIKIDRAFIQNISANKKDEAIIRAVIAIANSFELQVLAEGVETLEQLKFLQDEQCHEAQGFYFSKPLTVMEFEEFMQSYKQPPKQKAG